MTVAELLERIGSRELAEWAAYEKITGPLGRRRSDIQAAIIAATVANANRGKGRAPKPADFLPQWDKQPKTADQLWHKAQQLNAAMGGTTA